MDLAIKDTMQIGAVLARLALWGLVLLCGPAQGSAQNVPEAPAEVGQDPADLEQALRLGIDAYDRGDLVAARRAFELVHARAPTARTLRGLGLVAFRQQRYEDAVALLEGSLASEVKPLTEAQRAGVVAVLGEARPRVPKPVADVAVATPGPAARAPAEAPAAPTRAPGPRSQASIAPESALPKYSARGRVSALAPSAKELETRDVRLKRVGYALLGVAGAALIASVVSFQVGRARLHAIEESCRERSDGCDLEYVQKRERQESLQALGDLSLAMGISAGVLAASGTAILLWRWRAEHNGRSRAELGLGWQRVF